MLCPGNHDERAAFRQYLLGQPGSAAPINQVHYATGAVIALCDSSVPGQDEGFLEDETLAWLEDVMAQAPDRTPLFVGSNTRRPRWWRKSEWVRRFDPNRCVRLPGPMWDLDNTPLLATLSQPCALSPGQNGEGTLDRTVSLDSSRS